jgi:hypothetical protein
MILLTAAGLDEVWRRTRHALPVLAPALGILVVAYPALSAARGAVGPQGREEVRPLMEHVRQQYRDGDVLYIYRASEAAARYYAARGLAFPGEVILGAGARGDPYDDDLNVSRFTDRGRIWFLFSHVRRRHGQDEETLLVRSLDRVGVRLTELKSEGASLYLYDLSRAR